MAEQTMAQSRSPTTTSTRWREDDDQQQPDQAGQLLAGTDVPVVKRYVVEGQNYYYHNQMHPGSPVKDLVQVYYQFRNEEKAGLGLPMPAGVLRVYQQDSKGGLQFVGEDRIAHAEGRNAERQISNAFDVV